MVKKVWGYV